jgi:phosphoglycerate kinase
MGVDIGPETARDFKRRIREAKTIFWAGPLGAFEFPPFNKGTDEIANAIAESNAFTVIGGGETAAAAKADFDPERVFISTGGGAALQFVSGKTLPGLEVLQN